MASAAGPAPYGIVDARAGFVSELVTTLADALRLPAPVRDSFLFDASGAFYTACSESVITLQRAARKVIEHLGLACGTVVVSFVSSLPAAGRIERSGADWFIEIDARYRGDGPTIGAILAHECCHIVLHDRRIASFGNALDEVRVDLAAMLTGLGALTLNAIVDDRRQVGNQITYEHRSFGYLRAHMLEHAYADVCARLGLPIRAAIRPLRSGVVRRGVVTRMLRAKLPPRREPLAAAPLADHVIVACPSLACPARLRVPTGRRGRARCPKCGTSREHDGQPLVTRALERAIPLEPRDIPKVRPPSRAAIRMRSAPLVAKLALPASLLLVGALLLHLWRSAPVPGPSPGSWHDERALGQACVLDVDCATRECLTLRYDLDEALGGPRAGSAAMISVGGYCTQRCADDSDCPGDMTCGPVQTSSHDASTTRACVRR